MADEMMSAPGYPSCPETEDGDLVKTWEKAVGGDSSAQYMLGWAYENGLGVRKSRDRCVAWYRISKNNGNKKALLALGNIEWGSKLGFFEQVVEVLEKSAKKGNATSMYWLG